MLGRSPSGWRIRNPGALLAVTRWVLCDVLFDYARDVTQRCRVAYP